MADKGRVAGKVALVTGGASGLGAASARRLAAEGAKVMLTDVAADAGLAICDQIQDAGGAAAFETHDVTRPADWERVVAATTQRFGRLDILVNNAGVSGGPQELMTLELETWRRVMAVNLDGVFLGMRYAGPAIAGSGGGSIINISSIAAIRYTGVPYATYYASKAAISHLTRTTAVEYAARKVRVNAILPGLMETPMVEHSAGLAKSYAQGDVEKMWQVRASQVPMGIGGSGWDVAWGVVFLASDESRYITGAELVIDGGLTLKYA